MTLIGFHEFLKIVFFVLQRVRERMNKVQMNLGRFCLKNQRREKEAKGSMMMIRTKIIPAEK